MPVRLPASEFEKLKQTVVELEQGYEPWKGFYKDLADYILPMRYSWLEDTGGGIELGNVSRKRIRNNRNNKILDGTGTRKARDLAAGMLNGVTSPARPWFSLRPAGFPFDAQMPVMLSRYLQEVQRRILLVLAESNFYNSMAIMLLDLVVFGTAGMLTYEDFDEVVRFYNLPMGSFRIGQSSRRVIDVVSRTEVYTVRNLIAEFGEENCTDHALGLYRKGGAHLFHGVKIHHLIEPNVEDARHIPGGAAFREFYWEVHNNPEKRILRRAIYHEKPGTFPRWETFGSEPYGLSPAMDALGDIIQLQQETLRKARIIDKIEDPPTIWDAAMRNRPTSTLPGGRNFAPGASTVGGKPVYTPQAPLGELTLDIQQIQQRIAETFYADLFRMISQLDTVRSATEIDARREEKLILMGAVLERLENEALDPIIMRVAGIMERKGLLPEMPPEFADVDIEVQYVSVLSDAQRAVGTGAIERAFQVIGNLGSVAPEVLQVPDWREAIREYFERLNVPASVLRPRAEVEENLRAQQEQAEAQQAALVGRDLTQAAQNLSKTEVGGGRNALQEMLG